MAIGYAAIGALSDRVEDSLAFYGRLEIGIGLCGVLAPRVFAIAPGWVAALFLLLPTALMGGTLPPLVRAVVRRGAVAGEGTASLYALNSAGGALGVIAAGFLLIPMLGFDLAGSAAATLNILAGLMAIGISRRKISIAASERKASSAASLTKGSRRVLFAAVFVSGFAALCYEVGWIRLLALSLGASTYSFTVMLASFVAGVAIGGAGIRRAMPKIREPLIWFGALQLAIGVAVIVSIPLYERLPFLFQALGASIPRTADWFMRYEAIKFAFCFFVMLVPASLLGAALPLAADAASRRNGTSTLGALIGGVFGLNTLGNVLGAATAGLVLMPILGLRGLLCTAAMLNLIGGVSVLFFDRKRTTQRLVRLAVVCVVACGAFVAFGHSWDQRAFITGSFLYRPGSPASSAKQFKGFLNDIEMLYYRDGANATVAVTRMSEILQLRVNGKVDASNGIDMATQTLLAQVPLLLRPQSKDIMVVGLGSGVTVGAALTHPIRSVTVAEISPEVVEASAFFRKENGAALEDSRVRLHVGDARSLLTRESTKYDAIISEPSNPWMAGIGDLYTREFFQTARSRLKVNGLFVQWLHTYLMTDEDLRLVLRTIAVVFPDVQIWMISRDILIVAGEHDSSFKFGPMTERMETLAVRRSLAGALVSNPAALFSLHLVDNVRVRQIAGWPGPINEDGYPLLEYAAPKGVFLGKRSQVLEAADARFLPDLENRSILTRWGHHKGGLTGDDFGSIFHHHWKLQSPLTKRILLSWAEQHPNDPEVKRLFKLFKGD